MLPTSPISFSPTFHLLGPFQTGTREATWGADPLEYHGGFHSLHPSQDITYHSSLTTNGTVHWSTSQASVTFPSSKSGRANLLVRFPDVDWESLKAVYGWAALQYQAWARGTMVVHGEGKRTVVLYTDQVLEFWVDDEHYFGGDLYAYRKAPLILHLEPGEHRIDIRIVRDVRAMGGVGEPTADVVLEAEVSEGGLEAVEESLLLPDLVEGRLASSLGSINLRNEDNDWIDVLSIQSMNASYNVRVGKSSPFRLAPGQTRPLAFTIGVSDVPRDDVSFFIMYKRGHSPKLFQTPVIKHVCRPKKIEEPQKITYQHTGGIVSYAILRPPSEKIVQHTDPNSSLPIVLNLHGAGVETDSDEVRQAFDEAPDLRGWLLFPSGVTLWCGDDWHRWGFADVEAAVNAIPTWMEAMKWNGPGVDIRRWLVTGHSNGGRHPHNRICGIPIHQQHGDRDDNVPPRHSRRLSQLLSQIDCPSEYVELPGSGHYFEGVMTTPNLLKFYHNTLEGGQTEQPTISSFDFVVANPGSMGSKRGIVVDQLISPGLLGKIQAEYMAVARTWRLRTSNVQRLHITEGAEKDWFQTEISIDGTDIQISRDLPMSSQWLIRLSDGSWKVTDDRKWLREQRYGRQLGGFDAILDTDDRLAISTPREASSLALQISRNLFQYYGADAALVEPDQLDQVDMEGRISLLLGLENQAALSPSRFNPIFLDAGRGLVVRDTRGRTSVYDFQDGLGVIFLRPGRAGALELLIWGYDLPGLSSAARLVPMLTGVGQPDFVVLGKECSWKGAAGVHALGYFDSFWNISVNSTELSMPVSVSTGSPPPRSRPSTQFVIHDDAENADSLKATRQNKHNMNSSDGPSPLSTSKLGNVQGATISSLNTNKKAKVNHDFTNDDMQENSYEALLAKLNQPQQPSPHRKSSLEVNPIVLKEEAQEAKDASPNSSIVMAPASDKPVESEEQAKEDDSTIDGMAEMLKLKKELEAAKQQLELQKRELDQNRIINQTLEQALGEDVGASKLSNGHKKPGKTTQQPFFVTSQTGSSRPDLNAFSNTFEPQSIGNFHVPQDLWSAQVSAPRPPLNLSPTRAQFQQPMAIWGPNAAAAARPINTRPAGQGVPSPALLHQQPMPHQRILSGPASPGTIGDGRFVNDFNQYQNGFGLRRNNLQDSRQDVLGPQQRNNNNGWSMIENGIGGLEAMNIGMNPNTAYQTMGMYQPTMPYQPRPIGTPLSPTASEYRADDGPTGPWNNQAPGSPGQVYVQPMEPLNYRRLLDRSVSCNWKYIVDKIVCNNDQQASIFLQQKLKVGTVEQKYEIIEAIVAQAYPLMVNRFGNFLVQRCFEHGTPEQVVAIANAIRGNTLSLSMDAFGCHVVQKAFDAVPEEYKAIMVHELLRRIPETVIHRYACHVWQKLFELRWADSPPQIMKYVNEALRGMWHDVALGETGSLVVQNIFENCLEEDKRPCINEVLNNIDIVAHGQFGNWCIQHICEHGAPQDRSRAIDHVLRYATEYSMDQFASKVVEKCLKIGGSDFMERYLERVCEGRADRPRIPLIDIASDQYGNYLIQYILTHANNTHREIVASNVRKHMVSLRGSKFGSRVGMLCCNPAYATHPGPGVGMSNTRFASAPAQGPRFGGAYR
ncbi:MAG: hypothetical protein Q9170_002306 [Blastenia crenularia]